MSRNCFARFISVTSILLGLVYAPSTMSQTTTPTMAQKPERVSVAGSTSQLIAKSADLGRMTAGQNLGRMLLVLSPSEEQESAAAALVSALHDPSSPLYHKWLSPPEFGQQFGISEAHAVQVRQWLLSQGLMVHEISQSRRFICFSGTVAQVENAFSTAMHTYSYNHHGKDLSFISNSTDIEIPAALQSVVKGVVRLHSDPRSPATFMGGKVHFKKSPGHFSFDDGSHYMTPADFAKIYNVQPLYDAGIDGTGQTIAIVGRSNIDLKSVTDYRAVVGLPVNDPQIIVNGDDPGQHYLDMQESLLDVTWAGAVAPMATIKFVVSQSNFADGIDVSAAYTVDHNLAPVMSTSYGSCEQNMGPVQTAFYNSLWQQAAAQGITAFVSSGDNGGAGCDPPGGNFASGFAVNGIASTPYNVAVGGTQFDDLANPGAYWSSTTDPVTGRSALGYIPEKVWNESTNDPNSVGLWAGSGGVSTLYAKPDWQTAFGVPNDGKRDVPDFSLTAAVHDGYLVCLFDSCANGNYFYVFGGTSASSPSAAGVMALVNQKMGGQRQGVANYVFYRLAVTPGVYHDTTAGDNKVPDANGQFTVGFSAGPGYDLASGLGSFDANALVDNWQSAANSVGTSTTLALAGGQSLPVVHGTPITFHANVNCSSAGTCAKPKGSVSLMATAATGDTVAVGVGSLSAAATGSAATIQTSSVPGGSYTVTSRYSGDAAYYSSTSSPVQVSVTPETSYTFLGAVGGGSITTSPLPIGYGLSLPFGVVVSGASGFGYPTGAIAFQADGQPISAAHYNYVTGNWDPYTATLNYGEKSTIVAPGANPTSESSSIGFIPPGLQAGTHQLQASYPGDNSFGSSQASYSFTVTKADSQIQDFFPYGSLVANAPVKLGGQIGLLNGFAVYGGTVTITDITNTTPVVLGVGQVDFNNFGNYPTVVTFSGAGMHVVRLDYSGDANLNPRSGTYHLPIAANAPSNVSLSADLPAANAGSAITLTANVSSDVRLHAATGAVVFLDGTATVGTATLDVNGNAVLVTKTLSAGTHTITAHYPGDTILTTSDSSPITETIADYTVQVFPANLSIRDGMSGTAAFNIIPVGGFAQAVQFSCDTLPAHVSCKFAPSSVTLDGVNPATVALTVNTNSASASLTRSYGLGAMPSALAFAALLLPFGRRKRFKTYFAMVGLLVVGLCGIGCGGSSPAPNNNPVGAAPGTYSITINSTVGGATGGKTASLVLTITQ